jgi:predicted Zn finger-like uncharacterized protein
MILTCPDCATRYFVDETRLGPQGRKVRCAACGCSWRAEGEVEALELTPVAPPEPAPEPPAAARPADALPKTIRAQAQAKRRTRKAVAAGVVWGGLAAGFVLLFALAAIFRVQVVQLWPRTAGAYAAVHMTVNPLGLTPDGVQAAPDLLAGHAALTVTGAERNVDPGPRAPAPLRVSLYDHAGHKLAERIVRLDDPSPIRPGEGRSFKVSFVDPPLAGAQVGVDFVLEPPARRSKARLVGAAPQLRTRRIDLPVVPVAAPRTAQALPASSPYALPLAAAPQSQRPVAPQPHG